MAKKFFKKHRKIAVLLLSLNFLLTGSAFGQINPADIVIDDESEIFPFADMSGSESSDANTKYSENLLEVTDDGVYDSDGNVVYADESESSDLINGVINSDEFKSAEDDDEELSAFEVYRESIIENWGGKKAFTESRLKDLKEDLDKELQTFEGLDNTIDDIESKIEPLKNTIETLKSHIDLLNSQLIKSKEKIKNAEFQIAEKQIELKNLMTDLEKSEVLFNIQKDVAMDYIVLVYEEEEKFLDYYENSSDTLKLLLADNSVSENLLGREYSKVLEETGRKVFYDLYNKKVELIAKHNKIQSERAKLNQLNNTLNQEKRILQEGKQAKKELLEQTKGEEVKYQKLLDESIQQQLESAIAIQNMKDNIEFIQQKLELLDESLDKVENYTEQDINEISDSFESEVGLLDEEIQDEFLPEPIDEGLPENQEFIWPVSPIAITSYFHDPTYPKRWGIHNAVDIRAKQYTEIKAPANAYVFQTKDNGNGYSYIILAHKNRLITVYGHVTEIIAKAGTVVKQGDVIGLTGGTPGTKGAGWQTTGPHLHFEVWHKGQQVDPLDWLPVFELPIEYVPDRYLIAE